MDGHYMRRCVELARKAAGHTSPNPMVFALRDAGDLAENATAYTELYTLVLGTISLPINLPGTNYYQGFKVHDNILDALLTGLEGTREKLTDEQIIDLIITLIYSGYETMSTTSMMAVKYLLDHPKALEQLRKEHFDIRKGKGPEDAIDWNDFKSMTFT
ncbi:hypothetical protein E2562_003800 [Oryza meyeriana var. granulata]|uniref:Cytochrome P450 n=1 Tax=Oryza meyeriana var. granulata TaxID=110450 RepID=A0A6G1BSD3_9ORYZ|nr:hypothetical protein E2562_003800 [Oryza meyeriana var. granulata]